MRIIILGLAIGSILFLTVPRVIVSADEKEAAAPEHKPVSVWMEKKMDYSQQMLRALVLGELDDVAQKAEQMRVVSKVEGWMRGKKPGYCAQLQAFDFANSEILRHAQAENLEGTAMAFQQMTASCVSCHKLLRGVNGNTPFQDSRETTK